MVTGIFLSTNNINNSGNFYFKIISYLAAVLLIIAALLYFRKYFMKKLGRAGSGVYMKILDSISVGPDKQIILIETKNKILVVGVTKERIEPLTEFSREEFGAMNEKESEIENNSENNGGGSNDRNFLSVLRGKFNFKDSGKNEK